MPLLVLKHSAGAIPTIPYSKVFSKLNELLVETLDNAKLSSCKNWTQEIDDVHLGENHRLTDALVFLEIAFYKGRPLEQHKAVAEKSLAYLRTVYPEKEVRIMVEIREIEKETFAIS